MVAGRAVISLDALVQDRVETEPWEGGRLINSNGLWFRYFSVHSWFWTWYKRGRRIFCYSRRRINGKFLSWEYVCQKRNGPIAMRYLAHHKRRKHAKARAWRRFQKYNLDGVIRGDRG